MPFATKLEKLQRTAAENAERELRYALEQLSNLVGSVLVNDGYELVSENKGIKNSIEDIKRYSRQYDAAECIRNQVLSAVRSKIIDIPIQHDLLKAEDQIHDLFLDYDVPARGFIYIAWSQKPENYFYVGKAGSEKRLRLRAHGTLASTIRDATLLSLIFPAQSREEILLSVEASVMELIEAHTGELPRLNRNAGRIKFGSKWDAVNDVAKFLDDISRQLTSS